MATETWRGETNPTRVGYIVVSVRKMSMERIRNYFELVWDLVCRGARVKLSA